MANRAYPHNPAVPSLGHQPPKPANQMNSGPYGSMNHTTVPPPGMNYQQPPVQPYQAPGRQPSPQSYGGRRPSPQPYGGVPPPSNQPYPGQVPSSSQPYSTAGAGLSTQFGHMSMQPPPQSHTTGFSTGPPPGPNLGPPPTFGGLHQPATNLPPPPSGSYPSHPSLSGPSLPPPPTGASLTQPPTGSSYPPPPTNSSVHSTTHSSFPPPPSGQAPPPTGIAPPPTGMSTGMAPPPTGMSTGIAPPPTGMSTGIAPPPTVMSTGMAPPPTGMSTSMAPPPTGIAPPPTGMSTGIAPPPTGMSTGIAPPPTGASGHSPSHIGGYPRPTQPPLPPTSSSAQPPSMGQPYPGMTGPSTAPNPSSSSTGRPYGQPTPVQTPQQQPMPPEVRPVNLMEQRHLLPPTPLSHPLPALPDHLKEHCPDPSVFTSTMTTIPATSSMLSKMKLPLAIHIHPYKDGNLQDCPIITSGQIVRCRICRAYINPFVSYVDSRHWRCNLCFRPNTLPEDYDVNPRTNRRGDRSHHVELKSATVEYVAPSEYMVRPPQPSVFFFVIDVSYSAVQSGILGVTCRMLLDHLHKLPGDGRTMVGFLTVDSSLHFYNLKADLTQPQMLVISDLDDVFLPSPISLLCNLRESKELIKSLLEDLPRMFGNNKIGHCALGAALLVAEKLLHPIGGRVTVLLSSRPSIGPGAVSKEAPSPGATKRDQINMSASTDFYKKIALECSSQQIAMDLFVCTSQYVDLVTISTVSKFSAGQVFYHPDFSHEWTRIKFEKDFRRYLTRNIGFEAVMRIRCTEGLSMHTFHGNFFVRSTDLLTLPNVNPDHGFCMNISIDENLKDYNNVCFQAALLYTSYRGERRIRVHTLCVAVSSQPAHVYAGLNVQAITVVLAMMAADRSASSSVGDAREALMNTVVDSTKAYRTTLASSMHSSQFCLPLSLRLLPLFVLALLKNPAFTLNAKVSMDARAQAMNIIKATPHDQLMLIVYPRLYAIHTLTDENLEETSDGHDVVTSVIMQLSAEKLTNYGVFLLDYGMGLMCFVGKGVSPEIMRNLFDVPHFGAMPEYMLQFPSLDSDLSKLVRTFVAQIRNSHSNNLPLLIIREDGPHRLPFINYLIEDRTEDGTSYYEYLQHISRQIK